VQVRRLVLERFRGHERLEWCPRQCNLILGPNNAGKSTILEALDWLFDPGWGRPRPVPTLEDYWHLRVDPGFRIEAVLGGLGPEDLAAFDNYFEGWSAEDESVVPEPDGLGIETIVRVEVRSSDDGELEYRMVKPEAGDALFGPRLRRRVNFIFDGRRRDPARQLAFYQGSVLENVFGEVDLTTPLRALAAQLAGGQQAVNADVGVGDVLRLIHDQLREFGIGTGDAGEPLLTVGGLSERALLQTLTLSLRQGADLALPVNRLGRGVQRVALVALLMALARRRATAPIAAFEEPEEALEPFRVRMLARQLRSLADVGGQIFVTSHAPDVLRCFHPDEVVLLELPGIEPRLVELRRRLDAGSRACVERHTDALGRALFGPVAFLVDGPSDQAAIEVFWDHLAMTGNLPSAETLGVQVVPCGGTPVMPSIARTLAAVGKTVIALLDRDPDPQREENRRNVAAHARTTILHRATTVDLEGVLASELPLPALQVGIDAVAADLGLAWDNIREDIVSRLPAGTPAGEREAARQADGWPELTGSVGEAFLREAIRHALKRGRIEVKTPWAARLLAQAAVAEAGAPASIHAALRVVATTITDRVGLTVDLDHA
jgi:putative ATP-dependent endonuclease of the OLD family